MFRSIPLARYVLEQGGLYPAVYNAANEKAVAAFLKGECGFTDIYTRVEEAIDRFAAESDAEKYREGYTLEQVLSVTEGV